MRKMLVGLLLIATLPATGCHERREANAGPRREQQEREKTTAEAVEDAATRARKKAEALKAAEDKKAAEANEAMRD